jgi:glyoxylase-like metal-dependent hydrolase (beta-lactamase superfamily II)
MQVTEHIHAVKIPFQVAAGPDGAIDRYVYAYLVSGSELCLIDTGVRGSEQTIFNYVRAMGRQPSDISRIILTHSHPDHLGAARSIVIGTGAAVFAHATERAWIENVELQARERPVPGFGALVEGSVRIDHQVEDGEVLELGGGLGLEVLHTPGHSPGSISLFVRQDGAVLSGDAVPLPNDLPIYVDVLASVRSIRRLTRIDRLGVLLSAWDEPRYGVEAERALSTALAYLERIHQTVRENARERPESDPVRFAERVMQRLGAPNLAANPLVVRSIQAHLAVDADSLLDAP